MNDRELMQQALDALDSDNPDIQLRAATALRARLAQPEQKHSEQWWRHEVSNAYANGYEKGRASVKQPEQEPVATLFGSLPVYDVPPKQEPVAWVENLENARPHCVTDLKYCSVAQHERGEHLKYIPLYPAPSQREWQGLTTQEIADETDIATSSNKDIFDIRKAFWCGARWAEEKLKEKNAL